VALSVTPRRSTRLRLEMSAKLGPDLTWLVRAQGVLASCEEVTRLASTTRQRGAFAIDLANGTRLKGRRFETAARARDVLEMRARLGDLVAPLVAATGDAFLLAWVEGAALDALAPLPLSLVRRCGEQLGALHLRHVDSEGTVDALVAKLELSAAAVVGAGLVDAETARRWVTVGLRQPPERVSNGLVLRDYCPENLVLRPDGAIVYIDEANLTLGPLDHDLARTWLRWPMPQDVWAAFVAGYEVHRSTATFMAHLPFWATLTSLSAAALRTRLQVTGAQDYLARLADVLREHGP
jgi:hypothetical protein